MSRKYKILTACLFVFLIFVLFQYFGVGSNSGSSELSEKSVLEGASLTECQHYYKYEFPNAQVYGTFEEYPVTNVYTGPTAKINEDSHAVAKRFYTHHKIALEKGVNFAGRYAISDWGFTGVGQMFAVVDVETGDVYPFPYTVNWEFDFKSDSNLIVINPIDTVPEFADDGDFDCEYPLYNHLVTYYFLFENGEFKLLGPTDTSDLQTSSWLSEEPIL